METPGASPRVRAPVGKYKEIPSETVMLVARRFLVEGKTQADIANETGLSVGIVRSLCTARKYPMTWARCVGDLIVEGADITAGKSIRGRANLKGRQK